MSVIRTTMFQASSSAKERTMANNPTKPRIMEPEELEPKIVDGEGGEVDAEGEVEEECFVVVRQHPPSSLP